MQKHVDIVGLLFMLYGCLQLLGAALAGLLMIGGGGFLGALGASGGDDELLLVGGIYGVLGLAIAVFAALFAIPDLLIGMGLRRRRKWARIGGFVVGALALTNVPLGTMLGVYAFVVLLDKDVTAEFEAAA